MKIYKVGGSVRDEIMNIDHKDKDFVVVDGSKEELEALGFKQVGSDFPVFIDPKTKYEYALARFEKKTSSGYLGFETITHGVSLKDDLFRRDLTINAIAKDKNAELIDPFGGLEDIKNKILRHVSDAFCEDAIRVLRIARFQARFTDFTISDDTVNLILEMKKNSMLDELQKERIFLELCKVFIESSKPSIFFYTLKELGVLEDIFPFIFEMIGVKQTFKYHEEDLFTHIMMVIDEAAFLVKDMDDDKKIKLLFGALLHDVGKLSTYIYYDKSGKHYGHDEKNHYKDLLDQLKVDLCLPTSTYKFALFCAQNHMKIRSLFEYKATTIVKFFDNIRDKESLIDLFVVEKADGLGKISQMKYKDLDTKIIMKLFEIYKEATLELKDRNFESSQDIKEFLYRIRVQKIKQYLKG